MPMIFDRDMATGLSLPRPRRASDLLGRWRFADGRVVTVRGFDGDVALVRDGATASTMTLADLERAIDATGSRYLGR